MMVFTLLELAGLGCIEMQKMRSQKQNNFGQNRRCFCISNRSTALSWRGERKDVPGGEPVCVVNTFFFLTQQQNCVSTHSYEYKAGSEEFPILLIGKKVFHKAPSQPWEVRLLRLRVGKGNDWQQWHGKCIPDVRVQRTVARNPVIKLTFCPAGGKKKEYLPFRSIFLLLAFMLFRHSQSLCRNPDGIFSPEWSYNTQRNQENRMPASLAKGNTM